MADKTVAYTTAVAASGRVDNILAGSILATAPGFGYYHIFGRHAAGGGGALQLSGNVAGELEADRLPMNIAAGAPVKPDDHVCTLQVATGDTVLVSLVEVAGFLTTPSIRVEFQELTPQQLRAAMGR